MAEGRPPPLENTGLRRTTSASPDEIKKVKEGVIDG
jgi:hypothetical protein